MSSISRDRYLKRCPEASGPVPYGTSGTRHPRAVSPVLAHSEVSPEAVLGFSWRGLCSGLRGVRRAQAARDDATLRTGACRCCRVSCLGRDQVWCLRKEKATTPSPAEAGAKASCAAGVDQRSWLVKRGYQYGFSSALMPCKCG